MTDQLSHDEAERAARIFADATAALEDAHLLCVDGQRATADARETRNRAQRVIAALESVVAELAPLSALGGR